MWNVRRFLSKEVFALASPFLAMMAPFIPSSEEIKKILDNRPKLFQQPRKKNLRFVVQGLYEYKPGRERIDKTTRKIREAWFYSDDLRCIGIASGDVFNDFNSQILNEHVGVRRIGQLAPILYEELKMALEPGEPFPPRELLDLCNREVYGGKNKWKIFGWACMSTLVLDGNYYRGALLGDVSFMIIRDGLPIFFMRPQYDTIETPYVMGVTLGLMNEYRPKEPMVDAAAMDLEAKEGDLVVMASRGIWENVWPFHLATTLAKIMEQREGNTMYDKFLNGYSLAKYAMVLKDVHSSFQHTPFEINLRPNVLQQYFGNMEQATVIVALVTSKPLSVEEPLPNEPWKPVDTLGW